MPCHAMHPIEDLFLEGFSYVLQFDMHFIRTLVWKKFYSCEKWVLHMACELPFCGKVMVFGGDFRQVLPVMPQGTRAQITDATLLRSYILEVVWKICLTRNMWAQSDPWFLDCLLRIGNGTEDTFVGDYFCLRKYIVIEYKDEHSIDHLIDCVFPDLSKNAYSTHYMREHGILCTRSHYVDEINARMIDRFLGKAMVFYSFDSVDDDECNNCPQDSQFGTP
jgi:hypothetical protein